jgi:hypothetical protein
MKAWFQDTEQEPVHPIGSSPDQDLPGIVSVFVYVVER